MVSDYANLSLSQGIEIKLVSTDGAGTRSILINVGAGTYANYEDSAGQSDNDQGGTDVSMRLIDDGSPLYGGHSSSSPPSAPTPPPLNNDTGGGSVMPCLVLGLAAVFARRRHKKSELALAS